jgi:hypothetical protein
MGLEPILMVTDTWDPGPTRGVAELQGLPVGFERVFDEDKDDYSDVFEVRGLPPEAAALAVERDEIFGRWRRAFDAGKVGLDTHPALPEDRTRAAALKNQFDSWWDAGSATARMLRAACHQESIR